MIFLALLTALMIAAAPADVMGMPKKAYSACLHEQMNSNLKSKAAVVDFDKALATSCASQEAALKSAIIAQQLSMKASRKDAEEVASEWITDLRSNARENYLNASGEESAPST